MAIFPASYTKKENNTMNMTVGSLVRKHIKALLTVSGTAAGVGTAAAAHVAAAGVRATLAPADPQQ